MEGPLHKKTDVRTFKQFSLRTLLIALAVAPPLVALAWFGGLFAFYGGRSVLHSIGEAFSFPGLVVSLVLTTYSVVAPAPKSDQPGALNHWQLLVLWCCQCAAYWHFVWLLCELASYPLFGKNRPPIMDEVGWFSQLVAAIIASIATLRISYGLSTYRYVRIQIIVTGVLLIAAAPLWIASFLPR